MKFSKKTFYGLKFLLALTAGTEEEYFGIQQVSIGEDIPLKFLEAIAVALKKAEVVEVKRGAGGGYRLLKQANEITVLDVVQCLEDGYGKPLVDKIKSHNEKAIVLVMDQVKSDFDKVLGTFTLADIKKRFDEMNENLMYYI